MDILKLLWDIEPETDYHQLSIVPQSIMHSNRDGLLLTDYRLMTTAPEVKGQ